MLKLTATLPSGASWRFPALYAPPLCATRGGGIGPGLCGGSAPDAHGQALVLGEFNERPTSPAARVMRRICWGPSPSAHNGLAGSRRARGPHRRLSGARCLQYVTCPAGPARRLPLWRAAPQPRPSLVDEDRAGAALPRAAALLCRCPADLGGAWGVFT